MTAEVIRLGLIGDNIAASQAPRLHRLAGAQNGRRVRYDRLVPAEMGLSFDGVFDLAQTAGYRGVNVTYPYKERAAARVMIEDPLVQAIGAVNTVIFDQAGPRGFNTDYSGFVSAYRRARADLPTGAVLLIGAGGVGKAVAFGLLALGLTEIRVCDRDLEKASGLARAIGSSRPGTRIAVGDKAEDLAAGACGIVNCTPVGMVGYEGSPIAANAMIGAEWCFDAVYTPVETEFLAKAAARGVQSVSGYELFIGQGVDAWSIFTGLPLDETRLRRDLSEGRDVV